MLIGRTQSVCPRCLRLLEAEKHTGDDGCIYMIKSCPEHGKFLIRVRLSQQPDGLIRVSRLTYEATSEAAEAYARRAEKADPEEGSRPHRRRRRRASKPAEDSRPAEQKTE